MVGKRYGIFEISPEESKGDCDGCQFADKGCDLQHEDVEDEGDSVIINWHRGDGCKEAEKDYLKLLLQASQF